MPSSLALILCIAFVVYLLHFDHRCAPDVSSALWISTIWLIYVSSKPLAFWFGNPNVSLDAGSPYDRSFQIFLLAVSLWLLFRRGAGWIGPLKDNVWLSVLILFMLASVVWSPAPFISFKRWVSEIPAVVLGLLISTENSPRNAIRSVLRRSIYVLIPFSVLLIKYFPQYGVAYSPTEGTLMWTGVAMQKNGLGILASLASLFLVGDLTRRWKLKEWRGSRYQFFAEFFLLALSLWLLKGPGTYSATSIVMLVTGMSIYIGLMAGRKRRSLASAKIFMVVMVFLIVYGTTAPLIGKLPGRDFSSNFGRDSTLTGRSDIWKILVPEAMGKPLLGHGFGGFWTDANRARFVFFPAHNGYLETLLALGYMGLLLFSFFLLSSSRKAIGELEYEFDWGALWLCWLVMALINNITESMFPYFSNLLMAIPIWQGLGYRADKLT